MDLYNTSLADDEDDLRSEYWMMRRTESPVAKEVMGARLTSYDTGMRRSVNV